MGRAINKEELVDPDFEQMITSFLTSRNGAKIVDAATTVIILDGFEHADGDQQSFENFDSMKKNHSERKIFQQ
jgi:hypothetical protein